MRNWRVTETNVYHVDAETWEEAVDKAFSDDYEPIEGWSNVTEIYDED